MRLVSETSIYLTWRALWRGVEGEGEDSIMAQSGSGNRAASRGGTATRRERGNLFLKSLCRSQASLLPLLANTSVYQRQSLLPCISYAVS